MSRAQWIDQVVSRVGEIDLAQVKVWSEDDSEYVDSARTERLFLDRVTGEVWVFVGWGEPTNPDAVEVARYPDDLRDDVTTDAEDRARESLEDFWERELVDTKGE